MVASPLDSASRWLNWSNALYVGGAALTVVAAMYVLWENRAIAAGKRVKYWLLSEFAVVAAAVISLIGTIGAIHYGTVISHLKDDALETYKKAADVQIAQAQNNAATANQKAEQAQNETAKIEQENLKLAGSVASNRAAAENAEAQLGRQNKETYNFAHALAMQQQVMAQEAKVAPILNPTQIGALASVLSPYQGQSVSVHLTSDTTVGRLARGIELALGQAHITPTASIDMGQLYQGVSVVVHSPQTVTPLANALVAGLRQAGIEVHPVALESVPAGNVEIYLGPN